MVGQMGSKIFLCGMGGALVASLVASGCGGGSSNPAGPTTVISGDTGSAGASGATITITATGISPSRVTIAVGQSVTFVNSDSRQHEMASDPHPTHGSCPSIERGLGIQSPNQTKLTNGFANAGTCSFHDHLNDSNNSLKGQIVVQ
jgi:plastocyanin